MNAYFIKDAQAQHPAMVSSVPVSLTRTPWGYLGAQENQGLQLIVTLSIGDLGSQNKIIGL